MSKEHLYVQTLVDLMKLGLPPRLLQLYGRIRLYAGKDGICYAKQSTLAKEIGLTSARQIRRLLVELRRLKLIEWTDGPYHAPNTYRLLPVDLKWIASQTGQKCPASSGQGCPVSGRTKMSYIKEESSSSEESKGRPLPPNPPSPNVGAGASAGRGASEQPRANAKTKADGLDDDESLTPEQRFEARLLRRHGPATDPAGIIATVRKELENYPGVTFAEFLDFDRERSTGTRFRNPGGYYRDLARACGRARESQRADAHMAAAAAGNADIPRDAKGRCAKCGGTGQFKDGRFCDCRMGKDLSHALGGKRKAKSKSESTVDYRVM